jgi:hypothetical protein
LKKDASDDEAAVTEIEDKIQSVEIKKEND